MLSGIRLPAQFGHGKNLPYSQINPAQHWLNNEDHPIVHIRPESALYFWTSS